MNNLIQQPVGYTDADNAWDAWRLNTANIGAPQEIFRAGFRSGRLSHACEMAKSPAREASSEVSNAAPLAHVNDKNVAEWQPIETAPKDGTIIIGNWRDRVTPMRYLDNSDKQIPWAGWIPVVGMQSHPHGQPSLWQPLPMHTQIEGGK